MEEDKLLERAVTTLKKELLRQLQETEQAIHKKQEERVLLNKELVSDFTI